MSNGTMRASREHAGLSVEQAAKLLGTKVRGLRLLESGDAKPTPALWVKMLALYDAEDFTDAPRSEVLK